MDVWNPQEVRVDMDPKDYMWSIGYLQETFLPCYVVQCYGGDEYTNRSQKVNHKDKLEELPRTPYWF